MGGTILARAARFGVHAQEWLDRIERRAATRTAGTVLLGMGLAAAVVTGGIGLFVLVWAFLVGVLD